MILIFRFEELKAKKIHMIGIGGSGMYPLAQILLSEGYQLTGSDNNPSYTLDSVIKMGVQVFMGHHPENIGEDIELVVHTAAVFEDNPELVEARRRGIPTMERSVLLGIVANSFDDTVAVCGTHGKTTSTAMLTEVLVKGGKDPSAVIGGKLASIGGSGRVGGGEYMSCEACEFRDTFLQIKPAHSLILNVDEDHLEYFKTLDNIINSFAKFAAQTRKTVIVNGDDANSLEALKRSQTAAKALLFGTGENCEHRGVNLSEEGSRFSYDYYIRGQLQGRVTLSVPGRHNVLNSLGVLAAAEICGVDVQIAMKAVSAFGGAGRRFEKRGEFDGITVVDDYAHNPTELSVTLAAAKKMGYQRVVAVFQPFTFSRTSLMLKEFGKALSIADLTILMPISGAREVNTYGISSADLAALIPDCVQTDGFESTARAIKEHCKPGDLVLTLGCGDVYKVIPMLGI